jgi:hypothetical protein
MQWVSTTKGDTLIVPTTVYTGAEDSEKLSVPTAWQILDLLIVQYQFSEPIDLPAVTQAKILKLPLDVRLAWGETLLEAAAVFRRKFLS